MQPSDAESGFAVAWPSKNLGPSPLSDPKGYTSHASALIGPLIGPSVERYSNEAPASSSADTVVYPLFQLTPLLRGSTFDSTEIPALHCVLRSLQHSPSKNGRVTFTAGYFNPPKQLISLLLSNMTACQAATTGAMPTSLTVIAASPWANGFFGSAGISGMLPAAYTLLCRRFLEEVNRRGLNSRVKLLEWRRGTVGEPEGWTYHAKGLWITLPSAASSLESVKPSGVMATRDAEATPIPEAGPSLCLVGSSNYTTRSTMLDLEANALIVTRNVDLQRRLAAEEKWLGKYAKEVALDDYTHTERRVGLHVRIAMWIVSLVGGAL